MNGSALEHVGVDISVQYMKQWTTKTSQLASPNTNPSFENNITAAAPLTFACFAILKGGCAALRQILADGSEALLTKQDEGGWWNRECDLLRWSDWLTGRRSYKEFCFQSLQLRATSSICTEHQKSFWLVVGLSVGGEQLDVNAQGHFQASPKSTCSSRTVVVEKQHKRMTSAGEIQY